MQALSYGRACTSLFHAISPLIGVNRGLELSHLTKDFLLSLGSNSLDEDDSTS